MSAPLLLALALAAGNAVPEPIDQSPAACPPTGNVVAVFSRKREVWLCRDGAAAARFPVALGQAGTGKRRAGDRRTPTGTYALGEPRPSSRYGIFIPIDYPTREQAGSGHSGSDVGIHGPPRGQSEPDHPSTTFDWTLGCVATGTDADIQAVADFVREHRPQVVLR